jgi:hypothetical protein
MIDLVIGAEEFGVDANEAARGAVAELEQVYAFAFRRSRCALGTKANNQASTACSATHLAVDHEADAAADDSTGRKRPMALQDVSDAIP